MELTGSLLTNQKLLISPCFSVELPTVDAGMETGACPGHWERGCDESGRANPPECPLRGQSDQRGEDKARIPSLLEAGAGKGCLQEGWVDLSKKLPCSYKCMFR